MSIQQETEAKFHLNPQPKQAYRLKIKINDAPGPLKLMGKMGVGYKAEDCTYIINKVEGAPAHPEKMYSLISIKSMSLNMNPLYMQMLF